MSCLACMDECRTCNRDDSCLSCDSGLYLLKDGSDNYRC